MKRAFTLVELLVVVAVIAILMAVTFPVRALVRERGYEAVCQSNLQQMTVILKAYCSDHDGMFPNPNYLYHSRQSFFGLDPKKPPEPPTPYYGVW